MSASSPHRFAWRQAGFLLLLSLLLLPSPFVYAQSVVTISGTVTDNADVAQPGLAVELYYTDETGRWMPWPELTTTDQGGAYQFVNLPRSVYKVQFIGGNKLLDEYYDADPSPTFNDVIDLSNGPDNYIADGALSYRPVISGLVTDAVGTPASNLEVTLYRASVDSTSGHVSWYSDTSTQTTNEGTFQFNIGTLQEYRVFFDGDEFFVSEFYNNVALVEEGQSFTVKADEVYPNINAQLDRYGVITGTLTNGAGEPIDNAYVDAYPQVEPDEEYNLDVITDELGKYVLPLPPGYAFYIGLSGPGFDLEFYNNQPTITTSTPYQVALNEVIPNIDAILAPMGTVSGKITNNNGALLPRIEVHFYRSLAYLGKEGWEHDRETTTDAQGNYSMKLNSGEYHLLYIDPNRHHRNEYYNDKFEGIESDSIVVATGTNQTIDVELLWLNNKISGRVLNQVGIPSPGEGVTVKLIWHKPEDPTYCCNVVDMVSITTGFTYEFTNFPPGNYSVLVVPLVSRLLHEYYPATRAFADATVFNVSALTVIENLDFEVDFPGRLAGRVVDKNNQPIPGITVTYDTITHTTDLDGWFAGDIIDLPIKLAFTSERLNDVYAVEYYDNKPSLATANSIVVPAESTLTITVQLDDAPVVTDTTITDLSIQLQPANEVGTGVSTSGQSLVFSATSTGSNVSYLWDFGDGKSSTGAVVSHVYRNPGNYTVTLTARNSQHEVQITRLVAVNDRVLVPRLLR